MRLRTRGLTLRVPQYAVGRGAGDPPVTSRLLTIGTVPQSTRLGSATVSAGEIQSRFVRVVLHPTTGPIGDGYH